jgi:hypothetical protein
MKEELRSYLKYLKKKERCVRKKSGKNLNWKDSRKRTVGEKNVSFVEKRDRLSGFKMSFRLKDVSQSC